MSEWIRFSLAGLLLLVLIPGRGELRDPMEPYGFLQPSLSVARDGREPTFDANSLRLSGIFIGPQGNSAVINGRRLRVGDEIADAQLIGIENQAVELERDGERITIELLPITVKTPARVLSGGGE